MKINKKKALLIGLASSVLFAAAACKKDTNETTTDKPKITTEDNQLEDVYGPPVEDGLSAEENVPEVVYGPPVDENSIPAVYGPPEDFGSETTTEE